MYGSGKVHSLLSGETAPAGITRRKVIHTRVTMFSLYFHLFLPILTNAPGGQMDTTGTFALFTGWFS